MDPPGHHPSRSRRDFPTAECGQASPARAAAPRRPTSPGGRMPVLRHPRSRATRAIRAGTPPPAAPTWTVARAARLFRTSIPPPRPCMSRSHRCAVTTGCDRASPAPAASRCPTSPPQRMPAPAAHGGEAPAARGSFERRFLPRPRSRPRGLSRSRHGPRMRLSARRAAARRPIRQARLCRDRDRPARQPGSASPLPLRQRLRWPNRCRSPVTIRHAPLRRMSRRLRCHRSAAHVPRRA